MRGPKAFGLGLLVGLAAFLATASTALAAPAVGPALPGPPLPCGPLVSGCLPVPVPVPGQPTPQAPRPFATATPSPSAQPSPGVTPVPGAAPAPGQIPTDFGIGAMTKWAYNGGSWLAPQIYPMLTSAAGKTDWFTPLYQHMENIGFLLMLLFFVLGIATAVIRKDGWLLVKVPVVYAPLSIGVTVLAIVLVQELERVTDGFTAYMLQAGLGDNLNALLVHGGVVLAAGGAGVLFGGPESFIAFLAGLAIVGGLLIAAFELIARQVAIYACLLFIPVTIVTIIWPRAARLAVLMIEVIVGLILLKWIVAAVLALGAAMLAANPVSMGPQGDPGFITIVMGAVVVLGAVIGGPLFLAKALPFVEHQAVAHWSQPPRQVMRAVSSPRQMHQALLSKFGRGEEAQTLRLAGKGVRTNGSVVVLPLQSGSAIYVRPPRPTSSGRTPARKGP